MWPTALSQPRTAQQTPEIPPPYREPSSSPPQSRHGFQGSNSSPAQFTVHTYNSDEALFFRIFEEEETHQKKYIFIVGPHL